ncbi:YqhG family protein [Sporosarcina thermotolerans]|uniref:YqhG family protein n=1 Tax=Sporosarcina thermotolerans TaxID=633404 RepID=A0AAW9ABB2_9BACL|nr:YqhG family protein [Sporosarcina thermotolerans]MDW0117675.1 YqhG family protein [Sporosarcina thermotolerans]
MYPQQIHQYVRQFFQENNCEILRESNDFLNVQLTIEMDKRIMNRPFYWKYLESTGDEPNPAQLTLITDKNRLTESIAGEVVHYGSPRLNQLFKVTKELGSFVQMYEKNVNQSGEQTILTPWVGVNYKITYSSDRTKEILYSLGINLLTGAIINGFQESISHLNLESTIAPNTFHVPYIIKPLRALERLDAVIENQILHDDHTWAEEAKERLRKDLLVLEYFYRDIDEANRPECYEGEKKAMEEQYETKVKVEVINGGLFYLQTNVGIQ